MSSTRPAAWVSPVLCAAVLAAGLYAGFAGLGTTRLPLFLGGLAALVVLDLAEHHRYPAGTPRWPAAALLAARTALFFVVVSADGAGVSRALFVLVPFTAYFAFGRTVAIGLGAACVGLAAATAPHWYSDAEQVSDLVMLSLGLVLAIAMAAVAVEERRGRERLAELSATAERNRVARDIHDDLGHHLTAVVVLLEKASAFRSRDPEAADRAVTDAERSARRALDDVRRSVRALRAERFRLFPALRELVADQADVALDLTGDEEGFSATTLGTLYRAAQEGVTNSRRHADARRITVTVDLSTSHARLVVGDDGRGYAEGEGFGLLGMRERVQLAGGSVDIAGSPGEGTRLTVTIPR
ncbi:sensor histidine kinase [Lentzea tibetensis]|uniref:Oxygen sensor histidine kinase NreB n=1 Tax=Lentzea tibetensis TaxID=2591470 RepID=A0A563F1F6_9PSEU|nr:sensor histidine kinase [Lentzea tibetensis]TWP53733.1 sensor histidine kinase [Lentzea tibetensis]